VEQTWADIDSGLDQTSLGQIRRTVSADDHALRALGTLAAERPERTVVLWEEGVTSWRKAAYYFPRLEVIVLSPKRLSGPSSPVVRVFRGPRLERGYEGPAPLRVALPAVARVVWFVKAGTGFFRGLTASLPLQQAGPLYYCDLPPQSGQAQAGDYLLSW
ncbi:MAG TPA: hypothetical protein VEU62_16855, partial [Bryobacterales bacterium]|nr:hypothetical protein [Bryobacterales bacterium]